MTPPRMYFAAAALSTLALGVTVASGWGQDHPEGKTPGTGVGTGAPLSAWSADRPSGSVHVEANVRHADAAAPRTGGDIAWN
ncbi:hypothetical protein ACFWCB_03240 [Streptomyces sp. NPDC060048]|uniref:hypothetical protein n=1 Tax=unclassified Streptomyces TaxID=2593676 RepID=UPI00368C432B